MPTLHNITSTVLTSMSMSYSLAVAALRCSSWNKPRTQSFWGWRRSHSSFLSPLRRLHCPSSCSAATRPTNTSEELRDVNRWLIPPGTVGTRTVLPALGSALLFTKERWKKSSVFTECWYKMSNWSLRLIYLEKTMFYMPIIWTHGWATCWHLCEVESITMLTNCYFYNNVLLLLLGQVTPLSGAQGN